MTPYRQPIYLNDVGSDILAVKRALVKMGTKGVKTMVLSRTAGPAFTGCIKTVQQVHRLHTDGVYGPKTHAIVAPHFDLYGTYLYKAARLRTRIPPRPDGNAMVNAQRLLGYYRKGKYHPDNWGDLADVQATAGGRKVYSRGGYYTYIDERVMQVLVWLIECGYSIGTFAFCSDHHNDGPHGHSGGLAVDISSINHVSVANYNGQARANTLAVAKLLHDHPPQGLRPRQLICGGYGYHRDYEISACTIPYNGYYDLQTMHAHTNHLHCGF